MTTFAKQEPQCSPEKVYESAEKFTRTLGRFSQLPQSQTKQAYVRNLAEDKKSDVRYQIDREKYQNSLYRKLEKVDQQKRKSIQKSINEKDKKVQTRIQGIRKKQEKQVEKVNKHLGEVYKKHKQIEKTKKMDKDQQAVKLRKSLLQFYAKQRERKKQSDHKQLAVATCYQDAVSRLDQIHRQNQQFSRKSQMLHIGRMARNDNKQTNLLNQTRMKSAENKKKKSVYENNWEIFNEKQKRYIQTFGNDLDLSLKAFSHKQKEDQKTKQRLHKFFKQRKQKWRSLKHRVDQQKSQVPSRCIGILDKTTKASFRQTVSSFRDSGREWYDRVQQNKSMIYERDQAAKDKIMQEHLDMRMRNTCSFRVNDQMNSMRDKAKKLAADEV